MQLLNLLLGGGELFGNDADMLARREILGRLRFPRSRRFAANIVEIVFAIDAEVWVLEFEDLRNLSVRLRGCSEGVVHCRSVPNHQHQQMA